MGHLSMGRFSPVKLTSLTMISPLSTTESQGMISST